MVRCCKNKASTSLALTIWSGPAVIVLSTAFFIGISKVYNFHTVNKHSHVKV